MGIFRYFTPAASVKRISCHMRIMMQRKWFCPRTPPPSWLWFVPSPGERRKGFYHLWNHPIYGWEIFHISHLQMQWSADAEDILTDQHFVLYFNLLYWEVNIWMYKDVVHPVLWACSVCSAAPEVLSGGPYNHAADWWSLGILLFSLVTGKVSSFCPA